MHFALSSLPLSHSAQYSGERLLLAGHIRAPLRITALYVHDSLPDVEVVLPQSHDCDQLVRRGHGCYTALERICCWVPVTESKRAAVYSRSDRAQVGRK